MATLYKDIERSAKWISRALKSSGYRADFTPQSLREIDRFFEEQSGDGTANPNGFLSQQLGQRIFAIGSYIGEVARAELGGEWIGNDEDPEAEINVELHLPTGICWPIQRAMKRLKNGAEDGIAAWGSGLGLKVDGPPQTKKGFVRRLFGGMK